MWRGVSVYSLFLCIVRQLYPTLQGSGDSMPFNPMEGPVTIPMVGLSLQCMYDSIGLRVSPLFAQVRGKEYTPLGASSTTW